MDHNSFLSQGLQYLYRKEETWFGIRVRLKDEVSKTDLQKAVDSVLADDEYYKLTLKERTDKIELGVIDRPLDILSTSSDDIDRARRHGQLFCVSCEGKTLTLNYDHFLMDGLGTHLLLDKILGYYCLYHYDEEIEVNVRQLYDHFAFSREGLVLVNDPRRSEMISADHPAACKAHYFRVVKNDLIKRALELDVKPFSVLSVLLLNVYRLTSDGAGLTYSFPIDARKCTGQKDAPYNTTIFGTGQIDRELLKEETCYRKLNEEIITSLEHKNIVNAYGNQLLNIDKLHSMKLPFSLKVTVMDKINKASGFFSDVFVSYMGTPVYLKNGIVASHIDDCWFIYDSYADFGIQTEMITVGDVINISIAERTGHNCFADIMNRVFESEGIVIKNVTCI